MKASSLIVLALLFLNFSCSTLNNRKIEKLYLFKAEKGVKTIYLFGTIHYGLSIDVLPQSFWPYFDSADSYAFEKVENTPEDKLKMRNWILSKAKKPDGAPELKTLLTEYEYKKLDLYFNDLADKDLYFSNKSVFMVAQLVHLNSLKNSKTINSGWATLENQLQKKASTNKKLFPLDEATDAFLSCSFQTDESENLKALKHFLNRKTGDDINLTDSINHYKNGYNHPDKTKSSPSILNQSCYLTGRNKLWLPKLLKEVEKPATLFVTVGAAHISDGEAGLVELLTKEGFTVKRIEN